MAKETFLIKNSLQDKCLDVSGYSGGKGQNVQLYHCDGYDDQRWYFADVNGNPISNPSTLVTAGYSYIRNVKSNLCLDVSGHLGLQNDNVKIWTCEGGINSSDQEWSLPSQADDSKYIYNGKGKCLDVSGTSGSSGKNGQLWGCVGTQINFGILAMYKLTNFGNVRSKW